jgi:hypothetical protein
MLGAVLFSDWANCNECKKRDTCLVLCSGVEWKEFQVRLVASWFDNLQDFIHWWDLTFPLGGGTNVL